MWKTNKWVSEWVIRRAIAHLQAGPRRLCRCGCHRSRESKWRALCSKELQEERIKTHPAPRLSLHHQGLQSLFPTNNTYTLKLKSRNTLSFFLHFCGFFTSIKQFLSPGIFNVCLTNTCCCNNLS